MALPISIPDVLNIATDMQEIRDTPISVSLAIDPTSPGELSAHVRSVFASEAANARVRIDYVDDREPLGSSVSDNDIVVLIAGDYANIGELAERCREAEVPAMVVSDDPARTALIAEGEGHPIPASDIIAPVKLESALEARVRGVASNIPLLKPAIQASDADTEEDIAVVDDSACGRIVLDQSSLAILDERMGRWVVSVCGDKDLAFACAFPFIRKPLAKESISATSFQNGAIGIIPFLPGADMPVMTLNQVKMALQIATAYGQPLDKDRIKEIAGVVGGAFLCRSVVRSITKVVPGLGWLASGVMGFLATEAMGRALLEYFEGGGDIVGAANVMQSARDAAMSAFKNASASPAGQKVIGMVKEKAPSILGSDR